MDVSIYVIWDPEGVYDMQLIVSVHTTKSVLRQYSSITGIYKTKDRAMHHLSLGVPTTGRQQVTPVFVFVRDTARKTLKRRVSVEINTACSAACR